MISYDILALAPGTEVKFIEAELAIDVKIASMSPAKARAATAAEEEEPSHLLQMADNVGIISVHGGLTNRNSFWNRYCGMVAYDEIRQAIIEAVDNGAMSILFDYNTPGGKVSGMADVAEFISSLDVATISFSAGAMASAGYFLGCQSDNVYCDDFAEVGSIGVIVKTYDRSKMLAERGIKPIRFRSGDLKGAGDSDFKMSAKEKAYIQEKVDTFAGKFYNIVSEARGMTPKMMDERDITSGRTFIGQEAVVAQLVDAQKTFDESMLQAYNLAEKAVDKAEKSRLSYV
jgi:signal peptide peptidase SppA